MAIKTSLTEASHKRLDEHRRRARSAVAGVVLDPMNNRLPGLLTRQQSKRSLRINRRDHSRWRIKMILMLSLLGLHLYQRPRTSIFDSVTVLKAGSGRISKQPTGRPSLSLPKQNRDGKASSQAVSSNTGKPPRSWRKWVGRSTAPTSHTTMRNMNGIFPSTMYSRHHPNCCSRLCVCAQTNLPESQNQPTSDPNRIAAYALCIR